MGIEVSTAKNDPEDHKMCYKGGQSGDGRAITVSPGSVSWLAVCGAMALGAVMVALLLLYYFCFTGRSRPDKGAAKLHHSKHSSKSHKSLSKGKTGGKHGSKTKSKSSAKKHSITTKTKNTKKKDIVSKKDKASSSKKVPNTHHSTTHKSTAKHK